MTLQLDVMSRYDDCFLEGCLFLSEEERRVMFQLICKECHGPACLSDCSEHLCIDGNFEKNREELDGRSWKGQYKKERIISGMKAQPRLQDVQPHPSCAVGDTDFVRTEI